MADNFTANPGTGGDTFAADDIAGVKFPRSKVGFGTDGSYGDVHAGNPMPVDVLGDPVDYWPGYSGASSNEKRGLMVDNGGALVTRGAITTDEGTFRVNFANTSIAVSLGSCTVSGRTVTGTGFNTADVSLGDHFKFDADPDTAWMQIASIDSDTQLTLAAPYAGGSISGAASRSLVAVNMQNGAGYSVANGQFTMTSGTTSGASGIVGRVVDYAPIVFRAAVSISQRIANQQIRIGFAEPVTAGNPRWFARFTAEGTTNTTIICESGRNPTTAPSAAETQTTTVTLPNGLTTASMLDYRVEILTERVLFYVAGIRVAEHSRVMPAQHDIMAASVRIVNTGVAASNTSVVVDYMTCKNHNKLEIGVMSEAETIVARAAPGQVFTATIAANTAANTQAIILDCSQIRTLVMQLATSSALTAGSIQIRWSNDLTVPAANWTTSALYNVSGSGGTNSSRNGAWDMTVTPVLGRFAAVTVGAAFTAPATVPVVVFGTEQQLTTKVAVSMDGTQTVNIGGSLPGGTNAIGDVGIQVRANATGAASIHHIVSAATTNVAQIKATAGRVLGWSLSNTTAAWQYVKLHNVASATAGAGVAMTIGIAPNSTTTHEIPAGIGFGTAISRSIVTGAADNDTTATTVNAVVGDIFFA